MTKYEQDSLNKFDQAVLEGKFSNEALVQIIEHAGSFLNLQT